MLILLTGVSAAQAQQPATANNMLQQLQQQMQSMTPEERAKWMEQMQQQAATAAICATQVGMEKITALEAQGKAISAQVQALCAEGKKAEATAYAKREGQKLMQDPTIEELRICSKDMVAHFEQMADNSLNDQRGVCR